MHPSNFDELTKVLASSTSPRHALRTIVAASVGSFFGLGGIRSVFGANRDCAKWCKQVFGPNTPAAMQCTSDGAHHKGLCITCPNSVTPSSVCCVKNTSGYCSSYTGAHCCASGQNCQNGQCVTPCTQAGQACTVNNCCSPGLCCNGICCSSGQTCLSSGCCDSANVCGSTCLSAPCATNQCLK